MRSLILQSDCVLEFHGQKGLRIKEFDFNSQIDRRTLTYWVSLGTLTKQGRPGNELYTLNIIYGSVSGSINCQGSTSTAKPNSLNSLTLLGRQTSSHRLLGPSPPRSRQCHALRPPGWPRPLHRTHPHSSQSLPAIPAHLGCLAVGRVKGQL